MRIFFAVVFIALLQPILAHAEIVDSATEKRLSLPAPSPVVTMPKDDWKLDLEKTRPGNTAVYYMFSSAKRELAFSIYLDRTDVCRTAEKCLDSAMKNPVYKDAIGLQRIDVGAFKTAQFFLDSPQGVPIKQAQLLASAYLGGVWIDVHISKTGKDRPEMAALRDFLAQLKVTPPPALAARELRVPLAAGHGALTMQIPEGWSDRITRARDDAPPTVRLAPAEGGYGFEILITAIWPMGENVPKPTPASIREMVLSGLEPIKANAVERNFPLRELKGAEVFGYSFSATDAKPEPDGFKYLTQGALGLGDVRIPFTILTNENSAATVEKAITMLQGIRKLK